MANVLSAYEVERWWAEHAELDELVLAVIDSFSRRNITRASESVENLSQALEDHFSLEERVYFPLIERFASDHALLVVDAKLGHGQIRERLEQLSDLVATGDLVGARRGLDLLLARLRKHEEDETQLVVELRRLAG